MILLVDRVCRPGAAGRADEGAPGPAPLELGGVDAAALALLAGAVLVEARSFALPRGPGEHEALAVDVDMVGRSADRFHAAGVAQAPAPVKRGGRAPSNSGVT